MSEKLPIDCPEPLRLAFLDVLRWTLLFVRAEANDVRFTVALSDHAHNVPDLLRAFHPDRLRYYWEVERDCFFRALERIDRAPPRSFHEPWAVIESEYRRLCPPRDE